MSRVSRFAQIESRPVCRRRRAWQFRLACAIPVLFALSVFQAFPLNAQEAARISPNLNEPAQTVAVPYGKSEPKFPTKMRGYRLQAPAKRYEMRIFAGDGWQSLRPLKKSTNSCNYFRWVVRWRSSNPDIVIAASVGDTAFPPNKFVSPLITPVTGGAGWMTGPSCVAPGLMFVEAANGSEANLTDINYEVQIWETRPRI